MDVRPIDLRPLLTEFFGYEPDSANETAALQAAVARAQEAYRLPVTGDLDAQTAKVLIHTPRCGVTESIGSEVLKWGIKHLTYCIVSAPTGLSLTKADYRLEVQRSLAAWAAVGPLTFEEVSDPDQANLLYKTGRGRRAGFDGPGRTLAYAYFPRSGNYKGQSDMYLDLDEPWDDNPETHGILVHLTLEHEEGHWWGLSHTNTPGQLMDAVFNPRVLGPQAEDVARFQRLYGKPTAKPLPIPTTPAGVLQVDVEVRFGGPGGQVYAGPLSPKV